MGSNDFRVKNPGKMCGTRGGTNPGTTPRKGRNNPPCSAELFRELFRTLFRAQAIRKQEVTSKAEQRNALCVRVPPYPPTRAGLKAPRASESTHSRTLSRCPAVPFDGLRQKVSVEYFHGSYQKPACQNGAREPHEPGHSFTRLSGFSGPTPTALAYPFAHVGAPGAPAPRGLPELPPARTFAPVDAPVASCRHESQPARTFAPIARRPRPGARTPGKAPPAAHAASGRPGRGELPPARLGAHWGQRNANGRPWCSAGRTPQARYPSARDGARRLPAAPSGAGLPAIRDGFSITHFGPLHGIALRGQALPGFPSRCAERQGKDGVRWVSPKLGTPS